MISLEGKPPRLVSRAQRAIAKGADTRALKRELAAGNPYAHAFLAARGLEYRDGMIVTKMNTDPFFSSDAQEVFVPGERVFLTRAVPAMNEGAEATYAGHLRERFAVLDLDTPSGEPYRVAVPFDSIKNLYR